MRGPSGARPSVCRSRASSPGCRSRRSAIASTLPYVTRNWPEDETADTTGSVTANATAPQSIALPSSGLLGASTNDPIFFSASSQHNVQFEQRFAAVTDRFESRPFIPAGFVERIVREKDHPPMIMPRARPQLASLPPATGIRIPDDDPQLQKTAIYDINAKAVYMPNGEKLEAHSGLGQYMDDPKHVRLRMRGVTPPNSYKLTMRESRFHGVEAIRMNPEDMPAMFGRNGILVHPYMLGPNGQSNGCVSVKDYPKFLAAFKRGEVNRMVVVFRLPEPPAAYARRNIGKTTDREGAVAPSSRPGFTRPCECRPTARGQNDGRDQQHDEHGLHHAASVRRPAAAALTD